MKATDLRINDIVLYHNNPCKVIVINDFFTHIQFPNGDTTTALIDHLEPCEILEEYLEKNRFFEYTENSYAKFITGNPNDFRSLNLDLYDNCIKVYLKHSMSFGDLSVFLANIQYMHELQHILAIFNKEISL